MSSQRPASPGRLQGKVAIITGGGSGFGEAIAKRFLAEGATCVITDINISSGERVVADAESSTALGEGQKNIRFVQQDVSKAEDWKRLLEDVWAEEGRVDVLVNNAGISYTNKPTIDVTESEFDRVFNVNVKSIFLSIQAFMPKLLAQKPPASIINISSISALRPRPGLVWYCASKGAVSNATKGLAAEYGPHSIRVNAILPLLTATASFEHFVGVPPTEENKKTFINNVPLGRIGETHDVSSAAVFLASNEESSFITGVSLEVDGGRHI